VTDDYRLAPDDRTWASKTAPSSQPTTDYLTMDRPPPATKRGTLVVKVASLPVILTPSNWLALCVCSPLCMLSPGKEERAVPVLATPTPTWLQLTMIWRRHVAGTRKSRKTPPARSAHDMASLPQSINRHDKHATHTLSLSHSPRTGTETHCLPAY
jgi:hypothetical protein